MAAAKVMGLLQKSPSTATPARHPSPSPSSGAKQRKTNVFTRPFNVYFTRASAQVQPHTPDLLSIIGDLRERESRLKTELVEQKLLRQTAAIVPLLEEDIVSKDEEIRRLLKKVGELEAENHELVREREMIKAEFDAKIVKLEAEIFEIRQVSSSQRLFVRNPSFRKAAPKVESSKSEECELERPSQNNSNDIAVISAIVAPSRVPRVPKPPPKCSSSATPPVPTVKCGPPPPPPPPQKKAKAVTGKVKRAPEVVELYHSLMRRDTRRDSGAGTTETTAANAKDLVGEIENRSSYLIAIKTDVETQGDFIQILIKEVETASFTDIQDVLSFVKWLDDELSYLVDERAVLKHFDWPEKKADALREAAFEYSDLKKLEFEASSFRDDPRHTSSSALKKMQALLEKLEHAAYNLSRLRESATNRFKSFHIPVDWMLDSGFVSQIKLASVKLAMKYMKRVSAEVEFVAGFADEEELIVQGVRFAFRVHQFAGGFDVETMRAFEELRDKARACQNQQSLESC